MHQNTNFQPNDKDPSLQLARKLAFVHTVGTLEPVFSRLAGERLLGWEIASIVDESPLARTIENGKVIQETAKALAAHVQPAQDAGSDAIVVRCSTLGDLVDTLSARSATPLYRIDRGMAEKAVLHASTIDILATLPTTLDPTKRLLQNPADRLGCRCKFVARLCSGAFGPLKKGDTQTHDALIRSDYEILSKSVDLIVLAQASMAHALRSVSPPRPYLTSPELGMDYIADLLRLTRVSAD